MAIRARDDGKDQDLNGEGRKTHRRSYLPKVEALEALLLLDAAPRSLAPIAVEVAPVETPTASADVPVGHDAWDVALDATRLDDLLPAEPRFLIPVEANRVASGLSQLDRYLARSWARAGIAPQQYEDCSQAVYATLLQNWGRQPFEQLLSEVGTFGIRETLSRETAEGPEFFRAIDTVKKRAQRERTYVTLDQAAPLASAQRDDPSQDWRGALHEAIASSLTPRETALIQATLRGETPSEIAHHMGLAPKTVSNEKTRAIQKLREALVADLAA